MTTTFIVCYHLKYQLMDLGSVDQRPEQLLEWLKVRLGYVDETVWHDGQVWFKTKSIGFAAMGQDQFRQFFTRAVDLIVTEVIPDMDLDALLNEVSAMMGERVTDYDSSKSMDAGGDRNGDRISQERSEGNGYSRRA